MPTYRPPSFDYDPRQGQTMLDLILHQGQVQAQAAQQSGNIWGQALSNVGQTLGRGITEWSANREKKKDEDKAKEELSIRDRAWVGYVESGEWQRDPTAAYTMARRVWGPGPESDRQFQGLQAVRQLSGERRDPAADRKSLGEVVGAMSGLAEPARARLYPQASSLARRVYPDLELDPQYNPERWPELEAIGGQLRGEGEDYTLAPGQQRRRGATVIAENPAAPRAESTPAVGSFEDYAVQRFGPRPTAEQITQARKDYQQADDRPRVTINTPRPLSQTAEAGVVQRLTKQWDTTAAPVREINRQVGIMDAGLEAARRGDVNAGSQAVIQTFNKILDSLSVVREGEYARTAEGQSAINRVKGAIERLSTGGAGVPLGELEKFATLARDMAERQKAFLPAMRERIGRQADRYNIPQELIFEDQGAPPPGGTSPPAAQAGGPPVRVSSPEEASRLPRGTRIILPDGSPGIVP